MSYRHFLFPQIYFHFLVSFPYIGHNMENRNYKSEELPFPGAGVATLVGNEQQVQNLLFLIENRIRKVVREEIAALNVISSDKYADLPAVAKAIFWASKKGYGKGMTYGAKSFENWVTAAGLAHKKVGKNLWPKEVGIAWIEG